jgi:hypothetical protein
VAWVKLDDAMPHLTLATFRRRVFKRDRYECQYGGQMHGEDLHLDHIWPRVLGGTDEMVNFWTLCATCNLSKGAQHPMDWVAKTLERPALSWLDAPSTKFWFQLANACYHAEALGLWVSPDAGLWINDLSGEGAV